MISFGRTIIQAITSYTMNTEMSPQLVVTARESSGENNYTSHGFIHHEYKN
jgi:hypothetical protein